MEERGGTVTAADLEAYEPEWTEPVEVPYAWTRFCTRGGLSGVPELLPRLPRLRGPTPTDRVLALLDVFYGGGPELATRRIFVSSMARVTPARSRRASASARATSSPASICI